MTVETEVSDALRAVDEACSLADVDEARVGILGLSLGGFVAACVSGFEKRVKSTVLWSAVASLPETIGRRLDEERRRLLAKQGFVDVGGHALGKAFVDRMEALDPLTLVGKSSNPVLIVHGTADESVPVEHADRYEAHARHGHRRVEKFILEGADHTYARLDHEQLVIERAVAWFKETL
jgi:dipeptidyl aminopeptidase/acylaminoacyl peptidase